MTETQSVVAQFSAIEEKITKLQSEMNAVREVTTEVRDILTTFKTLGTFAKWSAGIGAAFLGLIAALKGYFRSS